MHLSLSVTRNGQCQQSLILQRHRLRLIIILSPPTLSSGPIPRRVGRPLYHNVLVFTNGYFSAALFFVGRSMLYIIRRLIRLPASRDKPSQSHLTWSSDCMAWPWGDHPSVSPSIDQTSRARGRISDVGCVLLLKRLRKNCDGRILAKSSSSWCQYMDMLHFKWSHLSKSRNVSLVQ